MSSLLNLAQHGDSDTMITYEDRVVVLSNCHSDLAVDTYNYLSSLGASVMLVKDNTTATNWIADLQASDERVQIIEGNSVKVAETVKQLPRIDTLITFPSALSNGDCNERELAATYVSDTLSINEAAIASMIPAKQGRIVNIISSSGIYGSRVHPHSSAAFAAINAYTRSFAQSLRETGVKLNAMSAFTSATIDLILDESPLLATGFLDNSHVLPAVAYLGHSDCPLNGETISAGGGRRRDRRLDRNSDRNRR